MTTLLQSIHSHIGVPIDGTQSPGISFSFLQPWLKGYKEPTQFYALISMWSRGHILAPLVMALYGTGPFSAPTPRRCPDHILSLFVSAFNRGPVWVVVTKGAQGADRVGSLYSRFLERRYQGRDILNKGSQTKLHPDTNLDQAEWFWPAQDSDTFDARWNYLRQANGPIPDLPYHLDQISSPPNIRLCPPGGYTSSAACLWFGLRQIQISDW